MLLVSSAAILVLLKTASKIREPSCYKGGVQLALFAGRNNKPSWDLLAEVSKLINSLPTEL